MLHQSGAFAVNKNDPSSKADPPQELICHASSTGQGVVDSKRRATAVTITSDESPPQITPTSYLRMPAEQQQSIDGRMTVDNADHQLATQLTHGYHGSDGRCLDGKAAHGSYCVTSGIATPTYQLSTNSSEDCENITPRFGLVSVEQSMNSNVDGEEGFDGDKDLSSNKLTSIVKKLSALRKRKFNANPSVLSGNEDSDVTYNSSVAAQSTVQGKDGPRRSSEIGQDNQAACSEHPESSILQGSSRRKPLNPCKYVARNSIISVRHIQDDATSPDKHTDVLYDTYGAIDPRRLSFHQDVQYTLCRILHKLDPHYHANGVDASMSSAAVSVASDKHDTGKQPHSISPAMKRPRYVNAATPYQYVLSSLHQCVPHVTASGYPIQSPSLSMSSSNSDCTAVSSSATNLTKLKKRRGRPPMLIGQGGSTSNIIPRLITEMVNAVVVDVDGPTLPKRRGRPPRSRQSEDFQENQHIFPTSDGFPMQPHIGFPTVVANPSPPRRRSGRPRLTPGISRAEAKSTRGRGRVGSRRGAATNACLQMGLLPNSADISNMMAPSSNFVDPRTLFDNQAALSMLPFSSPSITPGVHMAALAAAAASSMSPQDIQSLAENFGALVNGFFDPHHLFTPNSNRRQHRRATYNNVNTRNLPDNNNNDDDGIEHHGNPASPMSNPVNSPPIMTSPPTRRSRGRRRGGLNRAVHSQGVARGNLSQQQQQQHQHLSPSDAISDYILASTYPYF